MSDFRLYSLLIISGYSGMAAVAYFLVVWDRGPDPEQLARSHALLPGSRRSPPLLLGVGHGESAPHGRFVGTARRALTTQHRVVAEQQATLR